MHIYRGRTAGKSGGLPGFTEKYFFFCRVVQPIHSPIRAKSFLRVRNCFTVPVTEVMVGRNDQLERGSRVMAITHT